MDDKRIKIGMIGFRTTVESYPLGGIEQWVSSVVRRMESNFYITLFVRKKYHRFNVDYANIISVNGICRKNLETLSSSLIATVIATFKCDIIHYHGNLSAIWCFIPYMFKKKIVTTLHGRDWERDKWGKVMKIFQKIALLFAVKYSSKVVSCSQSLADELSQNYEKEILFVPNGFEENNNFIFNKNLSEKKYILYLGRIVPEKNIHLIIRAFKNIKTDFKFYIAGSAPYMNSYVKQLYKAIDGDERIKFIGPVERKDKWEILQHAHVLCLASNIEGMSLSVLEAVSLGKTCLLSNIDENVFFKDKITNSEGIFIFDLLARDDLQMNLEKLISLPQKNYLYENLEFFSWDRVAQGYSEIYKELV